MSAGRPVHLTALGVGVEVRGGPELTATFARLVTDLSAQPATGDGLRVIVEAGTDASTLQLLAAATRAAVEHSPLLCIHAGVVAAATGAIAIPGTSGLGKTTLTAALVRAGYGYVSDEALAIDRSSLEVVPFPRPLALGAGSWGTLGLPEDQRPADGCEELLAPDTFGRSTSSRLPLAHVVLAQRRSGPARLEPTERGEAVSVLLRRSFNHFHDPAGSFRAAVALVRDAQVWSAGYQEAPELVDLIAARIAAPPGDHDGQAAG